MKMKNAKRYQKNKQNTLLVNVLKIIFFMNWTLMLMEPFTGFLNVMNGVHFVMKSSINQKKINA